MRKIILIIWLVMCVELIIYWFGDNILIQDRIPGYWQYSDLRLIDPIDAYNQNQDIVAVLSRYHSELLQVRVDFVDINSERDFNLYLFIDTQPDDNPNREFSDILADEFDWDIAVEYANSSQISIVNSEHDEINNAKLRITTDIDQNSIVISLGVSNDFVVTSNARVTVAVTDPSATQVIDRTNWIRLSELPPPPINTALIFWNVIDGSTTATILRSWAGAHSGPQSTRHGLSYLLEAALSWEIPINICDLKDPTQLSSFEYMYAREYIDTLVSQGVIYSLSECANVYTQFGDTIHLLQRDELISILTMDLIDYYQTNSDTPLIIGNDLSISSLGSSNIVDQIFAYINTHPWIRVVGMPDFPGSCVMCSCINNSCPVDDQTIPYSTTGAPFVSGITLENQQNLISAELLHVPRNDISDYATLLFDTYIDSEQANVVAARGSYISQIGHFISAAFWVDNPEEYSSCSLDIDWDGSPECVLATTEIFITFELDGGYLASMFVINSTGVHQVIGSTTQYGVLRSDASLIISERGLIGDPNQIPGAFADPLSNWRSYRGLAYPNQVNLISSDNNTNKLFSIDGNVIHIQIENRINGYKMIMPVVVDPWIRYINDGVNIFWESKDPVRWVWGAGDLISISVTASTDFLHYGFNETQQSLHVPEDPNLYYKPGHYLPLTMALVEIMSQPYIMVEITIDPHW